MSVDTNMSNGLSLKVLVLRLFNFVFSPSEGPCCTEKCEFAAAGSAECSEGTECRFATNCTGKSTSCPIALHKSDSSTCESGSKVNSQTYLQ